MGRGGVQGIREMGAALQVVRQGTGNSEQAATAFEAVMNTLSDPNKIKILKSGGLKIFADDQEKILRPINELMVEIINKVDGKKPRWPKCLMHRRSGHLMPPWQSTTNRVMWRAWTSL